VSTGFKYHVFFSFTAKGTAVVPPLPERLRESGLASQGTLSWPGEEKIFAGDAFQRKQ